jgi:DNA-binding transcriptional LysR family regulator
MEMREMRSLAVLVECGTIQETAERCNLSAPAVHKHLKSIEEEFGVRVYTKRGGLLELTDAGRLLLPFVREVLVQHEAAAAALREWTDAGRGLLRVGAGPSFSSYLLPPLIKRYRRRFPNVDVFVETATGDHLLERLRGGHLDLIFDLAWPTLEEAGFEVVARWDSPTGFISGRADVPNPCRLKQLQKIPFILYQRGSRIEGLIAAYLDRLGFQPRVVMRSDSAEAIKAMIRLGLGISVLFLWNINSEPRSNPVSVLRIDAPPLVQQIALFRMKSHYTSRAVQEFIAMAKRMDWKNLHPTAGS